MVAAVLADPDKEDNGTSSALSPRAEWSNEECRPVAGVRLPIEGEYRDFWELPYARSFTEDSARPPAFWNFNGGRLVT